jgi:hypothetical protein
VLGFSMCAQRRNRQITRALNGAVFSSSRHS